MQHQRIDPIKYMQSLGWPTDHIEYDPKLRKGEYQIVRQSRHDGTLLFTMELMQDTVRNLAACTSFYKPKGWTEGMKYKVGPLKMMTVHGLVDLPCGGRYEGVRQRTKIAVVTVPASAA